MKIKIFEIICIYKTYMKQVSLVFPFRSNSATDVYSITMMS